MLFNKSLYSFQNPEKNQDLIKEFNLKKELLLSEGFLDQEYRLTIKGYLLKLINGYEQIPIINLITAKVLKDLTPTQIAGIIGGLANIEYNTTSNFPTKPFELKDVSDSEFTKAAQDANKILKDYETKSKAQFPNREMKLNSNAMKHLYEWAKCNKKDSNSRNNWKLINKGELRPTIRYEGLLFKEITMTADLLKQLTEIAEDGAKLTGDPYYTELENKFRDALDLIQHEPIPEE